MGFCYLNNVAVAALEALAAGVKRVAVYDFDVHHGNGTEDILVGREGAAVFSVHQHPCYPGTGTGNVGNNCFNFPLAPFTPVHTAAHTGAPQPAAGNVSTTPSRFGSGLPCDAT